MGAGVILMASTQAISTTPVTSSSSPRRTWWRKTTRTRVSRSTSRPTVSRSSRRAGFRYSQAGLARDEDDACIGRQLRLIVADLAHPFGAAALEELQVIGVIDDAAGIGILVIDANGDGEGVWLLLMFHRRILAYFAESRL